MPKDAGGLPYPEGWDHGDDGDDYAAVVFDESFVRGAQVHEPTAEERILAAVEARLERETRENTAGPGRRGTPAEPNDEADAGEAGDLDDIDEADPDDPDGRTGSGGLPLELRPLGGGARYRVGHWYGGGPGGYQQNWAGYGGQSRWQRGVAWVLALVMGVGVVLLAAAAVYRGVNSGGTHPMIPVPSSSPESSHGAASTDSGIRSGATRPSSPAPSVSSG
ncbi:SCO2584 family spore wall biosynthesis protein [Phaeacidiphilus oryzae]|jgi:hypothetical protein|uniref:SCO2584 family spore wall biosynthesis protein n=1 Tax=Phaeacidiphilus oryzae TaxID=348818 RepID=UPI000689D20D|nr:hypothetical protein [Phaeacidiphilus oryzae]